MVKRDRDGNEIDLLRWADLRDDATYRLVAEDRSRDFTVRTIWEGIDELPGSMYFTGIAPAGTEQFTTITDSDTEQSAQVTHQRVVAFISHDAGDPGLVNRLRIALATPATSQM